MATPFSTPIVSPVLVGRAAHVAVLRQCVDDVLRGAGRAVMIAGEAGIGKSRLLAASVADAEARGVRVFVGHCFEPDRSLPYAPVLDLLRTFLLRRPAEAEAALGEIAPELIRVMPELGRRFPGATPPPSLGPEHDQRRLLHALTEFFTELATSTPLLVAFEDVHWCDEASLDVLLHLARQVRGGCALVLIATYRSDEVHPSLAATLTALDRERLAADLRLMPLSSDDVEVMLRALSDRVGPLPTDVRAAIFRISDGNPFVIEELLRAVVTAEDGGVRRTSDGAELRLPPSATDAVRRRVARVSPGARATLTLAAVCGQRFDFPLLEALSGRDGTNLLDQIKELVAAQLVVEESVDRFAFRHALTREAITSDLLGRERRELHQRIAEAMCRIHADDPDRSAADLAYHWHQAGAWAEAYDCARRVGERALALYAPRSAIEHFSRAIDAAAHLGRTAEPVVYRGRGAAFDTLGDFAAARTDYETTLGAARSADDPGEEVEALLALGLLWASHDYARTGEFTGAALERARQIGDAALLARSLNRVGNWCANVGQPNAAIRHHEEALDLFRDLGDRRGLAETLDLLGITRYLAGDAGGSITNYREAIELLREVGDRQTLVSALTLYASIQGGERYGAMIHVPGSFEERSRLIEEAIRTAREIGWRPGEVFALRTVASMTALHGPGRALAAARQALRIAEEIGHRQWLVLAHGSLADQLITVHDLPAARRHIESALGFARETGSGIWPRLIRARLGSLLTLEGNLDQAAAALDSALDPDAPMETLDERTIWCARVDLALARGELTRALGIVDGLIATARWDAAEPIQCLPYLALRRGEALAALGHAGEAEVSLRVSLATAETERLLPICWSAHLALGKLARTQGRREVADREFAAARVAIEAFAAEIDDEAQRTAFLRRVAGDLPPSRTATPRQTDKAVYGGLTEREREVAVLVARGLTNPEIADALYVSRETARTHVGNILSKLGLKSRAQIAVWANQHGLSARDG